LRDDLSDELGPLADLGLSGDGLGSLGLDPGSLVAPVLADGNDGRVTFGH